MPFDAPAHVFLVLVLVAGSATASGPLLQDVTGEAGVDFVHCNGAVGELWFPEMTGQGGALFDADGDGDLDLLALQGGPLESGTDREDLVSPCPGPWPPGHSFSRNVTGRGELRFVDATAESGLGLGDYGMGVAVGDPDRDGDQDLAITSWEGVRYLRNRGDGTFEDATTEAGVDGRGWSTSATFADVDGDGWLDLFVARYVDWDLEKNPTCYATSSRRDYCGPSAFQGLSDKLWRNRGDGTFEDVSVAAGLAAAPGPALGVVAGDFDSDGATDLYVANDGAPNRLWSWQGERLVDVALLAGLAVNREGSPEASMGVVPGDVDNDGDEDLLVTHLTGETDTLYLDMGGGIWEDRTGESGMGPASLPATGFGAAFVDVDRDGWSDLVIADGAVRLQDDRLRLGDVHPLGQPNRLLLNRAGRALALASDRVDGTFSRPEVGRGLAVGDLDDDGVDDVVVFHNGGPLRIYRGTAAPGRWIGLDLREPWGAPAIGAEVRVETSDGTFFRRVRTDGSYCSASDPRIRLALGSREVRGVEVRWPDGSVDTPDLPSPGATSQLVRTENLPSTGEPPDAAPLEEGQETP